MPWKRVCQARDPRVHAQLGQEIQMGEDTREREDRRRPDANSSERPPRSPFSS